MILIVATFLAMMTSCFGQLHYEANAISQNFNGFVDATLQRNEMQQYWNSLEVSLKLPRGKQVLDNIGRKFSKKHEEVISAVKILAKASEASYEAQWLDPITNFLGGWLGGRQSCCYSAKSSSHLNKNSTHSYVCEMFSKTAPYGATKLSDNFERSLKENMKKKQALKRQYFASVDGVTSVFPQLHDSHCDVFESTKRPWFTRSMNRKQRKVVIILDNNPSAFHSMWEWYTQSLQELKKSAISHLNGLTHYDKIAIIYTSGNKKTTFYCKTCFHSKLVAGTEQNKNELRSFVQNIETTGVVNYLKAFKDAFSFFRLEAAVLGSFHDHELYFLSQSSALNFIPVNQIKKVFEALTKNEKEPVKFQVHDESGRNKVLETKLQNDEQLSKSRYASVWDVSLLQEPVEKADIVSQTPLWTFPYADRWSQDQVITASLPVYKKSKFIGVAAVDISLDEFFDTQRSINHDENTYTFLVNDAGHVIKHPLLYRQNEIDLNAVDIELVERDAEFQSIADSIKRGESGEKQVYATRYQQRGNGYHTVGSKVLITYFWKKIPNTKFTIGLAVVAESHISVETKIRESSLLYHRFDLSPPDHPCSHYNNYATMKKSSLFLSPRAFVKPSKQEKLFQETDDIMDLTDAIIDNEINQFLLKDGVRNEILATDYIQTLWAQNTYQSNVVWRHFTTPNGVFRIYPGIQIPDWYDPTTREWYHQSVALRDQGTIITTPYKDPASQLVVVTIAEALQNNKGGYFRNEEANPVLGVTGQDIRFDYFYKQFLHWFPSCSLHKYRCYMIDDGGFIILTNIANHYKLHNLDDNSASKLHITQMEAEISLKLTQKNVFQFKNCSVFSTGCTRKTFQISRLDKIDTETFQAHNVTFDYNLIPIRRTNAYVLLRSVNDKEVENVDHQLQTKNQINKEEETFKRKLSIFSQSLSNPVCKGSYLSSYKHQLPCVGSTTNYDIPLFQNNHISTDNLHQCYNTIFIPFELPTGMTNAVYGIIGFIILFILVLIQKKSLIEFVNDMYKIITTRFSTIYVPKFENQQNDKIEINLEKDLNEIEINTNRKNQQKTVEIINKFQQELSKKQVSAKPQSRLYKPSKDFDKKFQNFKREFEKFPQQKSENNNNICDLELEEQNQILENEYEKLYVKEKEALRVKQESDEIFQQVLNTLTLKEKKLNNFLTEQEESDFKLFSNQII